MKVLVLYWHPEPQSFCGALFRASNEALAAAGHEVQVSDLHAMKFNPVSGPENFKEVQNKEFFKQQLEEMYAAQHDNFSEDVKAEHAKLEWCDTVIVHFPLWWFGLPAMLKGWADRVLSMGVSYGGGKFYEKGVYQGKRVILVPTTGGPAPAYLPGGFNGDINGVLRPIHRGVFEFCGFSTLAPNIVYSPAHVDQATREKWLAEWKARVVQLDKEQPAEVGSY